jgi:hypothetical protein
LWSLQTVGVAFVEKSQDLNKKKKSGDERKKGLDRGGGKTRTSVFFFLTTLGLKLLS